ncbi:MAG: hypothetical protein ACK4RK_10110 [Gemmataceae bacterium]
MRRAIVVLATLSGITPLASGQETADPARQLIRRALQAHGGADQLEQIRAEQLSFRGTIYLGEQGIPFTAETIYHLPNRFRNVLHYELRQQTGTLIQVLNGNQGWLSSPGETRPFDDLMLAEVRERLYAYHVARLLPLLRDPSYQLTLLDATTIHERPAHGVRVRSAGHRDLQLYFDAATGLLVKTIRVTLDVQSRRELLQEEYYSDFREVNGVPRPSRLVVFQNGRLFLDGQIVAIRHLEQVDAQLFVKP